MIRRRAAAPAALSLALVLGLAACREVHPTWPPPSGLAPLPAAWSCCTVYCNDPQHPANRWLQRIESQRGAQGELLAADPATSAAARFAGWRPVDRAEVSALLDALVDESRDPPIGVALDTDRLLHDLVRVAGLCRGAGDLDLAAAHESAAAAIAASTPESPEIPGVTSR